MSSAGLSIRLAKLEDAPAAGRICYDAFLGITSAHSFPPYVSSPEPFVQRLGMLFAHPGYYCVVAEADGKIAGSSCMDERSEIAGIGPVTVEPGSQNRGAGRKLMAALLERARERRFPGVRLVQAAYHNRSLSLYATLGFDAREPLSLMQGPRIGISVEGRAVRAAVAADLDSCNRLCRRVHGHDRAGELADAVEQGTAVVTESAGRITGYSTQVSFFGHSVAESNLDLQALIAAAEDFAGPGILVPTRNAALFRWCLANGLRVVEPETLMTMGVYHEPNGAYLPSILY
jgi:GNAT superfamily N-acetyltransferase